MGTIFVALQNEYYMLLILSLVFFGESTFNLDLVLVYQRKLKNKDIVCRLRSSIESMDVKRIPELKYIEIVTFLANFST